ncbi:MAG: tetratricopeptide repeat protein [Oscillospiraceae bacterium]|nr:tetratricopeptide repeat protein [Oscillospiraceae bacterium]
MAIFKCKMCDAVLNVREGVSIYVCEYCGTKQTVPMDGNSGSGYNEKHESASVGSLLKRAFMFLEDGKWEQAKQYCERVLDIDPENGRAYLGKLMADVHVSREADLADVAVDYQHNNNYERAIRFGDPQMVNDLKAYSVKAAYKAENEQLNEQLRKKAENKFSFVCSYLLAVPILNVMFAMALIIDAPYIVNYLFIAISSLTNAMCIAFGIYLCNFIGCEKQRWYAFFKLAIIDICISSGAITIIIHAMYKTNWIITFLLTFIILCMCTLIFDFIGNLLEKRKVEKESKK